MNRQIPLFRFFLVSVCIFLFSYTSAYASGILTATASNASKSVFIATGSNAESENTKFENLEREDAKYSDSDDLDMDLEMDLDWNLASDSNVQKQYSIITEIYHSKYDINHLPTVEVIQNNCESRDDLFYFIFFNLRTVTASILDPDGTTRTMALNILWNCQNPVLPQIDPYILGDQTEFGRILLPNDETYKFDDGVLQTLALPVKVVVPEKPFMITKTDPFYKTFKEAIAVLRGGDLTEKLQVYSENVPFYEANGDVHIGGISWDASTVDLNTAGIYTITGNFQLPMHCEFSEDADIFPPVITVVVQEPDKPDIQAFSCTTSCITFPWIISEEDVADIRVWLSENNGPWKEMTDDNNSSWNSAQLLLSFRDLKQGSSYQLQVDHKNGQTGILCFTYDETIIVDQFLDGDRDGGDVEGIPPVIGNGKPNVGTDSETNTDDKDEDTSGSSSGSSSGGGSYSGLHGGPGVRTDKAAVPVIALPVPTESQSILTFPADSKGNPVKEEKASSESSNKAAKAVPEKIPEEILKEVLDDVESEAIFNEPVTSAPAASDSEDAEIGGMSANRFLIIASIASAIVVITSFLILFFTKRRKH